MTTRLILLCLWLAQAAFGQSYEYGYQNPLDSSFNCYLKVIPETDSIKGLVVRDYSRLPNASKPSPYRLTQYCTEAGLLVLYTNTSPDFPELFATTAPMKRLEAIILKVVKEHQIPKEHIFMGGLSAGGTRALRFAQYCIQEQSPIQIKGVFAVDAPLDLERFYYSAARHQANFKAGMLEEAQMMVPFFHQLFGGSPAERYEAYKNAAVFTQSAPEGGQAGLLRPTNILLFHEPDIDWWLEERGATYYDINSYDLAAFALQLKQLGHKQVQLITTSGKGFDRQGNRNCHSWSIVDERLLTDWMLEQLD